MYPVGIKKGNAPNLCKRLITMHLIYCSANFTMLVHADQNSAHSSIYKSGDIFDTVGCRSSCKNERLFQF